MQASSPRYSVVVPAFEEAHRIADTLGAIETVLRERPGGFQIIVVDDGSRDETSAVAARAGQCTRVLRNPSNRGKGHSVTRGMLAAAGDFVLFTDADLAVGASQFDRVLRPLERGIDVVIASRRHPKSHILVPQPKPRELMGVLFNALVRVLILPNLTDTQCGLKGFSRAAAREVFAHVGVSGWCFDVEVLTIAMVRGYRIAEVPVDWSDSGETRLRPLGTAWEILRDLTTVFLKKRLGRYARG
jgi:dolichyl-phosphate beta-glucosyltransferase